MLLPALDAFIWATLLYVMALIRLGLRTPEIRGGPFALVVLIVVVCQVALGNLTVLYRTRWRIGSFEEAWALARTVAGTTVALLVYELALHRHVIPISAAVVSGVSVLLVTAGYRGVWRTSREYHARSRAAEPVVVYGAGAGGEQVIGALLSDPAGAYRPVALLDDSPLNQNKRIRHLRVAGSGDDLGRVATAADATVVIIAIPSAGSEFIRKVSAPRRRDRPFGAYSSTRIPVVLACYRDRGHSSGHVRGPARTADDRHPGRGDR